jgi:hypothetical protein
MWTLISFTEIAAPLAPFKPGHVVGIVESDGGEREIIQVEGGHRLHIGMKGEIGRIDNSDGVFNFFVPEADDKIRSRP